MPVFEPYQQKQPNLLPPGLEELVPYYHPARIVSQIVDAMDVSELYKSCKGGGALSYDPRMSYMCSSWDTARISPRCGV